jgi:Asp-tRNA(Asn)/Glu-tRNA(Gln) amidotransferase A subunit family amidase
MLKSKKTFSAKKILIINKIEDHLPLELTKLYHQKIKEIKNLGYRVEEITIPKRIRDHLQITYLILCSTELVSHLNSLQGITYGVKKEAPTFGKD